MHLLTNDKMGPSKVKQHRVSKLRTLMIIFLSFS